MNEKDFYKFHVANDSNIDEVNFYVDLVLEMSQCIHPEAIDIQIVQTMKKRAISNSITLDIPKNSIHKLMGPIT